MAKYNNKKVCIIGPLPPPVHGLSLVNQYMISHISDAGIESIILNSRSKHLKRSHLNIILRSFKMSKIIVQYVYLLVIKKIGTLYISLSGGWGQIYDLVIIALSVVFKIKIFIHHHSFAYLNKNFIITNKIVNISRTRATHIVLCDKMGTLLKNYNDNISTITISNAAFIEDQKITHRPRHNNSITIGFLSNISFDKGIYEYIEIFKNLSDKRKINGIIAGPYFDRESQDYLEQHLINLTNIKYIGSVSNKDKIKFFKEIDFLLFPTNYKNEAEPLVIHEAMSFGIPVIAKSRGCINQMIYTNSGILISEEEDYITATFNLVNNWINSPSELKIMKQNAVNQFINQKYSSLDALKILIEELRYSF